MSSLGFNFSSNIVSALQLPEIGLMKHPICLHLPSVYSRVLIEEINFLVFSYSSFESKLNRCSQIRSLSSLMKNRLRVIALSFAS